MDATVNSTRMTKGEAEAGQESLAQRLTAQLVDTMAAPGRAGKIWIGSLLAVIAAAAVAYTYQLANGLKVTAMREYVSWGVYITSFVFFIGISHAGTLMSAILRVTGAEWRRPITRLAEAITVFALMVGAPMVLVDLGRIDRILNIFTHGRLNSPLLWDVCSILTYMTGSITFLYVAMIPDFALLKSRMTNGQTFGWRWRIYSALSLGYRGTPEQKHLLERAMHAMSVIIIPVAVSVHTVVSWIFGMTLRPGWHSTIFGPYFVIGAIYSGTATLILAMVAFRKVYHLENILTERPFRNLGRLLLALSLLYMYFTLSEYLTAWYGSEAADKRLLDLLMGHGAYGTAFWCWASFCLLLPALLIGMPLKGRLLSRPVDWQSGETILIRRARPKGSLIPRLVIACTLINIGMWLKRYLIIVPTLMTPFIPAEAAGVTPQYHPTWVEWTITAGAFAVFLLLFTLFAKVFPIVSIWETVEGVEEVGADKIGVEVNAKPSRPAIGKTSSGFAAGMAILLVGLFLGANRLSAAEPQPQNSQPQIALTTGIEDSKKVIVATVTREGRPIENARVLLQVKRTFGDLTLGEDDTLDDGTVAVAFPADLPGDSEGRIQVLAQIQSPPEHAVTRAQATLDGALKVRTEADPFPRAPWSPRAPLGLVLTICALLAIVWSTYAFLIVQLIKINKAAHA